MSPVVERITEGAELAEGPHWDPATKSLYYVDIFGKTIHRYVPSTKKHTQATLDDYVSFIIPVEGKKDQFVVSLGRKIARITWNGVSDKVSNVEIIAEEEKSRAGKDGNRFNDGKVDPSGRLWTGTMGIEQENLMVDPNKGALYSLDSKKLLRMHETGIHIANGLAWNKDKTKFYYVDSGTRSVDEFDFEISSGTILNRKSIFTFGKHGVEGFADGQTIDTDGNLWVAVFGGSCVIKIDPRKPETLLQKIMIPAKQVTSVAFGGPNLDQLFVTSARLMIHGEVVSPPVHGAVYVVKDLGVKGYPATNFKL